MTENSSTDYTQNERQDEGHRHLGYMTPRWTCLVIVDWGLLK